MDGEQQSPSTGGGQSSRAGRRGKAVQVGGARMRMSIALYRMANSIAPSADEKEGSGFKVKAALCPGCMSEHMSWMPKSEAPSADGGAVAGGTEHPVPTAGQRWGDPTPLILHRHSLVLDAMVTLSACSGAARRRTPIDHCKSTVRGPKMDVTALPPRLVTVKSALKKQVDVLLSGDCGTRGAKAVGGGAGGVRCLGNEVKGVAGGRAVVS